MSNVLAIAAAAIMPTMTMAPSPIPCDQYADMARFYLTMRYAGEIPVHAPPKLKIEVLTEPMRNNKHAAIDDFAARMFVMCLRNKV